MKEEHRFTHLSLFSGIGGLDLAAEMAGFVTVGQCEWADYPTKILERHWPDVPRWRDIRTLTGDSFYERTGLRTVDVISGGFPCQPFSLAGKRLGQDDDRYLWPEMLRVIKELRPAWVIGENVAGIINLALDQVLSDLENAGYSAQAFVVPACGVDAPHRRDRICILANSNGKQLGRDRTQENPESASVQGNDYRSGTADTSAGKSDPYESRPSGVVDGIRTAIHETDPDADGNGLQGRESVEILAEQFTECSCREREREREREQQGKRGYDGLLRSFLELTPLGKIGPMNPNWIEWQMGYPIGWTESNASETR